MFTYHHYLNVVTYIFDYDTMSSYLRFLFSYFVTSKMFKMLKSKDKMFYSNQYQ